MYSLFILQLSPIILLSERVSHLFVPFHHLAFAVAAVNAPKPNLIAKPSGPEKACVTRTWDFRLERRERDYDGENTNLKGVSSAYEAKTAGCGELLETHEISALGHAVCIRSPELV